LVSGKAVQVMPFENATNSATGNFNSVITLEIPRDSKLSQRVVTADIKNLFFDFQEVFLRETFLTKRRAF